MPLDERVRRGLREAARAVPDDAAVRLDEVHQRARSRARGRTLMNAFAAVLLLVVAVPLLAVLTPRAGIAPPASLAPSMSASKDPQGGLTGDYRVDLTRAGDPLAAAELAGPWRLSFVDDGSMLWAAPPGASISEDVIRDTYEASGSEVVLDLFSRTLCRGAGVGAYTVARSGRTLTFLAVRDACGLRRAVLQTAAWTRA